MELGADELMMLVEVIHGHGDSDGTAWHRTLSRRCWCITLERATGSEGGKDVKQSESKVRQAHRITKYREFLV